MKNSSRIGFLGAGNMARALISGLLKNKLSASQIYAYDIQALTLQKLKSHFKIQVCKNAEELVLKTDIVLLATKPQDLKAALQSLKPFFKNQILISIAAGIDLDTIARVTPKTCKIIRSMPNNPALIGEGITALYTHHVLSGAEKNRIENIFLGSGDILWVKKEDQLDAVTGLSGSGPAYVYQFIQSLTEAGVAQGLTESMAYPLALKTVLGSALTLLKTGKTPAELISLVTSKKGTTLEGLSMMKKKGFDKIIKLTVAAATRRAKEIKKELKK